MLKLPPVLLGVLGFGLLVFNTAFAAEEVVVDLLPTNNSGVSGVAIFSGSANITSISITFKGFQPGSTHFGNIYKGSCAQPGSVLYPLAEAVADKSGNATINDLVYAPLSTLTSSGYFIQYHNGGASRNSGAVCGDLNLEQGRASKTGGASVSQTTFGKGGVLPSLPALGYGPAENNSPVLPVILLFGLAAFLSTASISLHRTACSQKPKNEKGDL